jgi:hypothetical protein
MSPDVYENKWVAEKPKSGVANAVMAGGELKRAEVRI